MNSRDLQVLRKMGGSAQSILVRDDHRRMWVLKPWSALQGFNASANEYLGSLLCKALELPIPDFRIISVDEQCCRTAHAWLFGPNGGDLLRPGLHFASRYLPELTGLPVTELSRANPALSVHNIEDFLKIFVFDLWAMHSDTRQVLFTVVGDGLYPTFIDQSHLFGGPSGLNTAPFVGGGLVRELAMACHSKRRGYEAWLLTMEEVIPKVLDQSMHQLPTHWYLGDAASLTATLSYRLRHLRSLVDDAITVIEGCLEDLHMVKRIKALSNARGRCESTATGDHQSKL